jgi:hypothetical protein
VSIKIGESACVCIDCLGMFGLTVIEVKGWSLYSLLLFPGFSCYLPFS